MVRTGCIRAGRAPVPVGRFRWPRKSSAWCTSNGTFSPWSRTGVSPSCARLCVGRIALRARRPARRQLQALASWLETNSHPAAAASLREGLEETVTVLKLELPSSLRRFFATTN